LSTAVLAAALSVSPRTLPHVHAQEALPPLSYICLMAGDEAVLEDKPGTCPNPKCGMKLVPVRLQTAYSCITHQHIVRGAEGVCPIDKQKLVPITASMFWLCGGSDDHLLEPGKCPDGKVRTLTFERRPHGDHNPRHGGQFFMADDQWHHLEGTYPKGGPFRMYFYDDFTRPLAAKEFTGSVTWLDASDKELGEFPLKGGRVSNTLETPIKGATFPLKLKARVQFGPKEKVRQFDFTFPEFTTEPVKPVATTTSTAGAGSTSKPSAPAPSTAKPAAAPTPAAAAPVPAAASQERPPSETPPVGSIPNVAAPATSMSRTDATSLSQDLPNNTGELLKLLDLRSQEVQSLIQEGNFGMVYVPTMLAKEVALALQDHISELPARQQTPLTSAVRRLVLSSWRLDQYGDLGDRDRITQAHALFSAAVADIKAAYASR
jgi:hypothetical protein